MMYVCRTCTLFVYCMVWVAEVTERNFLTPKKISVPVSLVVSPMPLSVGRGGNLTDSVKVSDVDL